MSRTALAQKQNLFLYSQQADNAAWSIFHTTITANAVTAPDGTMTADKMCEDNVNNEKYVVQKNLPGGIYTMSVFAKAAENSAFALWSGQLTADGVTAVFDLTNITATIKKFSTDATTSMFIPYATINPVAGAAGWFKCTMTFKANSSGATWMGACLMATTASVIDAYGLPIYQGTTGNGSYIWQMQLTRGNNPGPLCLTTSSAVDTGNIRNLAPTTQNLLWWSQSLANGFTNIGGSTNADNVTTAPNGTTTASKLKETNANSIHTQYQYLGHYGDVVTDPAGYYTLSFYAKAAEDSVAWLTATPGGAIAANIMFDLNAGVATKQTDLGVASTLKCGMSPVAGAAGWYFCWAVVFCAGTGYAYELSLSNSTTPSVDTSGRPTYQGVTGNGVYIWQTGAQKGVVVGNPAYTVGAVFDQGNIRQPVPAQQNLFLQSQNLDTNWLKSNTTNALNQTTDPNGNTTVTKYKENNTNAIHQFYQAELTEVGYHIFSVYAKSAEDSAFTLVCANGTADANSCIFDLIGLTAKVVQNPVSSLTRCTIQPVAGAAGWYLCTMVCNMVSGSNALICMSNSATPSYDVYGRPTYQGVTGNGMYFWQAQFVRGVVPATLTLTTTAKVDTGNLRQPAPFQQNLFTNSQLLATANPSVAGVTWTAQTGVAPDGTTTADKICETNANSNHFAYRPVVTEAGTFTISLYAKAVERNALMFWTGVNGGNYSLAIFDLSGVAATVQSAGQTNVSATISPVAGAAGWFLCTLTFSCTSSGNYYEIGPVNSLTPGLDAIFQPTYQGVTGSGVLVWQQQKVRGKVPAVLTKTTTVAMDMGNLRQPA